MNLFAYALVLTTIVNACSVSNDEAINPGAISQSEAMQEDSLINKIDNKLQENHFIKFK